MRLSEGSERLEKLAGEFWEYECNAQPLVALMAGENPEQDALFQESAADYERRARHAEAFSAALHAIGTDELALQERATWQLLDHELTVAREAFATEAHRRPSLFPAGPEFVPVFYANTVVLTDGNSAERYAARLATVASYLADVGENLRAGYESGIRYPVALLGRAAANVRAMLDTPLEQTPWLKPFASAVARSQRIDAAAERVRALIDQSLRPALACYLELLEGPLSSGARDTLSCVETPGGAAFYEAQVRRFTTLRLTPDAIHRRGLDEVARLTEELQRVAADAGYDGRLEQYRRFLEQDSQQLAVSAAALRERAECVAKRIDKRIPAFFGRIPRITYGIETMPESTSLRMPPAYAQPNPADRSAPGIFWLTALPDRCPLYVVPSFVLHEAWPGHLMHLALMQEMQALPKFRRHGGLKYSACLEGWAVYCESLGVEMGLYETPHEHFGRLNTELWRAARLVIDTGIHWHGWTRKRAIEFFTAHVSLSADTIAAEVDRYSGLPAQALAYHLGCDTIRRLRAGAEQALGERFNLRRFHDSVMDAGPVTLPVLEQLLGHWLEQQSAA